MTDTIPTPYEDLLREILVEHAAALLIPTSTSRNGII